jgi:hypothetical protein
MYMIDKGWWFVPNELDKFTSNMHDDPRFNADGSLTLHFQRQSPGKEVDGSPLRP